MLGCSKQKTKEIKRGNKTIYELILIKNTIFEAVISTFVFTAAFTARTACAILLLPVWLIDGHSIFTLANVLGQTSAETARLYSKVDISRLYLQIFILFMVN